MTIMDKEIIEYPDVFQKNRHALWEAFPEMRPFALVVNRQVPDTKKLLKKTQKATLKKWKAGIYDA